jgi:hypothetical protein
MDGETSPKSPQEDVHQEGDDEVGLGTVGAKSDQSNRTEKERLQLSHLPREDSDPLFTLSSGKVMTRSAWVPWVQSLISQVGLKGKDYNGISPRKGGAESLRMVEAPNDLLRKMGRWADSSFVFETYQAISSKEMSLYASRIASLTRESLIAKGKGGAPGRRIRFHRDLR